MTRTQAGTTFEDWVRPHLPLLRRYAASLTSSVQDGEDLLQRALIRAWRRWETYDAERGSPAQWLLAILRDQARQRWRLSASPKMLAPAHTDSDVPSVGPAEIIDVRSAIRRLPRRQREAIIFHYYVGLKIAEIAALMQCAPGTVKATLSAARANLADYLGD